jgi:predicted O-methyltransferase YrrM
MQTQSDKPKKAGRPKKATAPVQTGHPWESETEVGDLIAAIIKMSGIKRVLELGTLTGKTTTALIEALPSDGSLTTVDIKDLRADAFKDICESDSRVKYINGDSIQTCQKLKGNLYDLIFVDTVHEWSYALPEFKAIESLMDKGCILAYHDSISFEGIARLVRYAQSYKYNAITLNTPNANGLTLLQR